MRDAGRGRGENEREISSAETFTRAMVETGRAVSVGRPTGGATLIPRTFRVPSGLLRFRLGCTDRRTPIRGVRPEGAGTPPEVFVPYDPVLLGRHRDPVWAVGMDVLRYLLAGADRGTVTDVYGGIPGADAARAKKALRAFRKLPPPGGLVFGDVARGLARAMLAAERRRAAVLGDGSSRERLATLKALVRVVR